MQTQYTHLDAIRTLPYADPDNEAHRRGIVEACGRFSVDKSPLGRDEENFDQASGRLSIPSTHAKKVRCLEQKTSILSTQRIRRIQI